MHSLELQLLRGMNQIEIDTTSLLFKVYFWSKHFEQRILFIFVEQGDYDGCLNIIYISKRHVDNIYLSKILHMFLF